MPGMLRITDRPSCVLTHLSLFSSSTQYAADSNRENPSAFVLITDSSRGVRRAIALAFADRGAQVAVHYHTPQ